MDLHKQVVRTDAEIEEEIKDEFLRVIKSLQQLRKRLSHTEALLDVARDEKARRGEIEHLKHKRDQLKEQITDLEFKKDDIRLKLVSIIKSKRS